MARRRLARWWSVTARGTSIYASGMPWTPYADLDELIEELLGHWGRILGDGLAGAWIQGSFALGAGDLYSDCDWIVATHAPLTKEQVAALAGFTTKSRRARVTGRTTSRVRTPRSTSWRRSSTSADGPTVTTTAPNARVERPLNRAYTRWILREHGITLIGPEPRTFMPPVPPELLRREAATAMPTLMADLATWLDIDVIAWGQRYAVVTACRLLYTLVTAEVASKAGALEWAMRTLDPSWRPLLGQVRDDRMLGFDIAAAARLSADGAGVRGVRREVGRHHRPGDQRQQDPMIAGSG